MDGNGRWARRRGLPRTAGHTAGEEALAAVTRAAVSRNIGWLTVFGFSTENWVRPRTEVRHILGLHKKLFGRVAELNDLNTNCSFTRIFHVNNQVLAEADLVAETLDPEELQTVMRRIHKMAIDVTPTLSAVFGGQLVENPEDARKGEYRTTVLEIETFPGTWVALNGATADRAWNFPASIFVITGWSPQGVDLGEWAHEKANRTIANTITDIGGRFLHGHGRSPNGDHSEPSLFAWGISDADAMEIARRANQDAIFEVTATEVTLLSCDDGSRESWSRFQ